MAEDLVNGIVQVLLAKQQQRTQRFKDAQQLDLSNRSLQAQTDAQKAEEQYRKDTLAETISQHKTENTRADLEAKAVAAFRGIQQLHELQGIQEQSNKTGQMVPGGQLSTEEDIAGNFNTSQTIPGTDIKLPFDPSGYRQNLQLTKEAEDAPRHRNQLEETAAQFANQEKLAGINNTAELGRTAYTQSQENRRTRESQAAETLRANAANATRLQVEKIQKEAGTQASTQNLDQFVHGAIDGDYTLDDLKKMFPKEPQTVTAIVNGVTQAGGVIPDKDQKQNIVDLQSAVEALKLVDQFNQKAPKTEGRAGGALGGVLASNDSNLATLGDELSGRATAIARTLAKEKGNLSNKDIERVLSAYIPSRFEPTASREKKRNDFASDIEKAVDSKLANLSPAQKAAVKKKIGLSDLMKSKGSDGPKVLKFDAQGNQIGVN